MKRTRQLTPEERRLWSSVARQAKPMASTSEITETDDAPSVAPRPPQVQPATMRSFDIGEHVQHRSQVSLAPAIGTHLAAAPLLMDHKTFQKLKRGKSAPDARIDLHGMTIAEAHDALHGFIAGAFSRGLRLVLVITGKGQRSNMNHHHTERNGVLRHQVPQWLSMQPLSRFILQVVTSHQKHGGAGAYYVYLRKRK